MNVWTFIGRLGGNAEVRFLPNGDPLCQFSVAVDSGYGEKKTTTWVRCSMFGARGEKVAPYILKGDKIGVTGEAKMHTFTGRDGTEKVSMEVRVNNVELLGDGHQAPAPQQKPTPAKQQGRETNYQDNGRPTNYTDSSNFADFDDDIPF